MFAMTAAQAQTAQESINARQATYAGHHANGTFAHEAYVDPTYNEKYCKHCEEYLGKA